MDIFRDSTKTVPKSDGQIVRVNMEELEIGGRKSHLPTQGKDPAMSIDHVPNAGTK
jgi:hypothetical protein